MTERERDKARIDRLLDAWDAVIREESSDGAAPSVETLTLASRSLPPLLERRSKLLGLDAVPGEQPAPGEKPMDRILKAVPGQRGS